MKGREKKKASSHHHTSVQIAEKQTPTIQDRPAVSPNPRSSLILISKGEIKVELPVSQVPLDAESQQTNPWSQYQPSIRRISYPHGISLQYLEERKSPFCQYRDQSPVLIIHISTRGSFVPQTSLPWTQEKKRGARRGR